MKKSIVVGITGASGIIYSIRLISELVNLKTKDKVYDTIYVVYTKNSLKTCSLELGVNLEEFLKSNFNKKVIIYKEDQLEAPLSSSSKTVNTDVVIVPCTLNTLAKISSGIQDNLLTRVALNALRLHNKLVLVVRETPLSPIDLINMAKLAFAGAIILPASPGFYNRPKTVDEMVNFIVGKILDVLGIENNLYKRWNNDHP